MKRLSNLARRMVRPKGLWTTAIYIEDSDYRPGQPFQTKPLLFSADDQWWRTDELQGRADPFLFAAGERLFLFLEAEPTGGPGRIDVFVTSDGSQWEWLGTSLRENHHLAYPFVFSIGDCRYLIPDSSSADEVCLYQFTDFPFSPIKVRTLLEGTFYDSSVVHKEGTHFLFTTSKHGLEIYFTDNVISGDLHPHPSNPITRDPSYQRCGGGLVLLNGVLFRLAQDCSERYGGGLNLMRVKELSRDAYCEELQCADLLDRGSRWNRQGGHHLSIVQFRGKTIVAVDGQRHSYVFHKYGGWLVRQLRAMRKNR